jgi:serine/threonine-protein kinase HipA
VSQAPQEDVATFTDAAIFNWIIGGSDAHAKNFSLLLAAAGRARLAPIYDVASILPYAPQVQFQDIKLAMKIGGEYRLSDIGLRHWKRFADENRLDFDAVRTRIEAIAAQLPDLALSVQNQLARKWTSHALTQKLVAVFTDRSKWVADQLSRSEQNIA